MKSKVAFYLFLFLSGLLVSSIPQAQASSVIEKFPTSTSVITPGWVNPTKAYAQDEETTYCGTHLGEQEYDGFGFAIPTDAIIERTYVKALSSYYLEIWDPETNGNLDCYVRIWNGTAWQSYHWINYILAFFIGGMGEGAYGQEFQENRVAWDITAFLDAPAKVNNAKVRLYLEYSGDGIVFTWYVDVISLEVTYTTPAEENGAKYMLIGSIFSAPIMLAIALHYRKHQKP